MFLNELDTRYIGGGKSKLLQDFLYEYIPGKVILVPKGFITDFASIPRIFRWLITGNDNTKRAAVIHDFLYDTQPDGVDRKFSDAIFLLAMGEKPEEFQVKEWKRTTAYSGVRIGGWYVWRKKKKEKESKNV